MTDEEIRASEKPATERLADRINLITEASEDIGQALLDKHGEVAAARFVSTQESINHLFEALARNPGSTKETFQTVYDALSGLVEAMVNGDNFKTMKRMQNIVEPGSGFSTKLKEVVQEVGGNAGPSETAYTNEDHL